MSSSFEDFNSPDITSEHPETLSRNCRLEKDSSNDADMFEDSSGEDSQPTCGLNDDDNETSKLDVETSSKAETASQNIQYESYPVYEDGENLLMTMTDEEREFSERYREGNQSQLSSLKCTICSCQLFLVSPENIRIHPALGVLVCKNCREFYSNGPFTQDEDGHDEYCRWCAEGGMMICCDTCSNVFCKACLRRCVGRVSLLDITSSKNNWNCLVCNNLPLWGQRALSRMVLAAIRSYPGRKSVGGRSLLDSPSSVDTTDPSVWLPAMINEAEKLATYCKVLASKVGINWSKTGSGNQGDPSENDGSDNALDKLKVVNCCRKLRKAVVTTRLNMNLLEKKLVDKFEQKYGNASDIDVEPSSEASSSNKEQSPQCGKRLIVKIKNFREANRKQDFYAEIRNSPIPPSRTQSKPITVPLPQKSDESVSSLATLPCAASPQPTRQIVSDDDDLLKEEMSNQADENKPTNEDSSFGGENDQFYDTVSEVNDDKSTEKDSQTSIEVYGLGSRAITKERESETHLPKMLKNAQDGNNSVLEASPEPLSLHLSSISGEIETVQVNSKEETSDSSSSPILSKKDNSSTVNKAKVELASLPTTGKKTTLKQAQKTHSSNKSVGRIDSPVRSNANSSLSSSVSLTDTTPCKPKTSTPDANERARLALLENSDDSDDSLDEIKLSPRVKRTKKRNQLSLLGLDDPKLRAECAVVVSRITNLDDALAMENGNKKGGTDSALNKEIDQLIKPIVGTSNIPKDHSDPESDDSSDKKPSEKIKPRKSKKDKPKKKSFSLDDLWTSSTSESEFETPVEISDAIKPPITPSFPSSSEAVRQALLASSDSETEFDLDMSENLIGANEEFLDQTVEEDLMEVEIGGEESVGVPVKLESEEENEEDEEDASSKASTLKKEKLLRVSLAGLGDGSDDSKTEKESKNDKKKKKAEKKKRRINSDSDFESSGSEKKKQKQKRKRISPSDIEEFSDEDADSSDEAKSKPKRRRRIKKTSSSDSDKSDDSDIQVLNESQRSDAGGSKGRKNIKKIMKDTSLKDETKAAAKEEEDRKKRIADRQKFYNEAFVGDLALINAQIDHLPLDFDPKTKEELVTVDKQIVTKLKPHQVKGVKFMWDACFESIERIKEHPGSGCILAHCMGLGKSLQVVTLAHTVLTHKACQVDRVLVVCPLSTVLNWVNEFKVWLPPDCDIEVYELASVKAKDLRVYTLRNWFEGGGVMIIGYDMYRNLTNENNKRIKSKARDVFIRSLVDPGPQLVVCDEGHLLKNETTALSKAMNRIATKRRVVLTGTPLQNSLLEYHCMIQFVKPNLLGTKKEFTNRFANPIKNGQAADSTDADVRVMKRRAHVLHKMLEDSVQRFDYAVLTPFLPPKHEYVISVKMSDIQIKMYQYYLEHHAKGGPAQIGRGKGAGLFADFQELGRVWTHPKALLLADINRESKAKSNSDTEGSLADFIDDRLDSPLTDDDGGVVCLDDSGDEKGSEIEEVSKSNGWKSRTRAGRGDQPPPVDELGVTAPMSGSWWSQFVTDEDFIKVEHSGKLVLLMDILRQCELIGDKVLVFSQSLVSLSLIEEFLAVEDQQNAKNRESLATELKQENIDATGGTWRLNADYFRLDGQTSPELRKNWCNAFNNPSNLRSRLFLISTKAGGLGINLVAANRVIIFDASWNPSHDVQSIFRVYRFGQKKPCYIYRFLAQGTMEEKIYDRQVTKLSLSCRVVDEQQIERHFNSADLSELYVFEPDSHLRRPTPLLPKDRLLAELTIQRKDWIVTYHVHDSLLENKSEEELSESERKAAWDDFENEKRGVNPMGMMMHESPGFMGMPGMPEILGGLAGRSVAGIPLSSIAAMIYNSNPGITQDEFLGRLRLTVDQLQNFSVQQAAAAAAASAAAASAQNALQQPGDAQRLLMQRQVAADQLKRQFGNTPQPTGLPGPSGVAAPPRSRGRPTIGPHQRTDLYGLAPVIYSSSTPPNQPPGPSGFPSPGSNSVPKT